MIHRSIQLRCMQLSLAVIYLAGSLSAAEWTQWRGPQRNGITDAADWTPAALGPDTKPAWRGNIGAGFSSIVHGQGRVYTMGNRGDHDIVSCLDAETGKKVWEYSYAAPLWAKNFEGGPCATPTLADGRVYTVSRKGQAFCLEADTGDVLWQRDLGQEEGVEIPKWGMAGSALVWDGLVIMNVGSAGMALDPTSGKTKWLSGKGMAGYATPVPFSHGAETSIAVFSSGSLVGLNPKTGKALWSFPWKTKYGVNSADPIFIDSKVFISSGYGTGCALLDLASGQPKLAWKSRAMRNHMNSSIITGGHIYGFDEKNLKCLDLATGEQKWNKPGLGKGSLIMAAGKLVILGEKGVLAIAEATPDAYKEISRAQILRQRCWTPPALSGGRLYARDAKGEIVCIDLRPGKDH